MIANHGIAIITAHGMVRNDAVVKIMLAVIFIIYLIKNKSFNGLGRERMNIFDYHQHEKHFSVYRLYFSDDLAIQT